MISIVCPWGNATGGTELLHQLGNVLNNLGFDACMYYIGERKGIPACNPQFERYEVSRTEYISDGEKDILIFPELIAKHQYLFEGIKNARKILWWLSVDNANLTVDEENELRLKEDLIHFVQSYYAEDYVVNHLGIPADRVFYLSDYIGTRFLNAPKITNRQNIVLFNPRKGFEKTSELIKNSNASIMWRALEGVSGDIIPQLLLSSKVYIDFGNHPGKDRFPREAVACGCRVLTGKRGAAAYYGDVMLPDELKIEDDEDPRTILSKIYSLIDNYNGNENLYEEYNRSIHEEFHLFETDAFRTFSKITFSEKRETSYDNDRAMSDIANAIYEQDYRKAFQHIVAFRCENQKDGKHVEYTEEFLLLECYARLGLKQYEIVEYMLNNILEHNQTNYEAHILLAEALYYNQNAFNRLERIMKAINKSLEMSANTDDAKIIDARAMELISSIKGEVKK